MPCFAWAIDYESGNFWVAVASLVVAVIVSGVSLGLSWVSVRISKSSLNLTKELAERELRDWTQRKWFDLYVAAEHFRTLLERFQTIYDRPLPTLEFEKDANDLTFAIRETLPYATVFPQNPTIEAFFNCIRKWKLDENLFSKEMLAEYIDAIEGFRQEARVQAVVIQKPSSPL
jgi:hypothetical protein